MAKISLIIDTRRCDNLGRYPIKIRISNGSTNTTVSTGVLVSEQQFIGEPYKAVSRSTPDSANVNDMVAQMYNKYHAVLMDLKNDERLPHMSATDIRKLADGEADDVSFTKVMLSVRDGYKKRGTWNICDYAYRLLHEFMHKTDVLFSDVNHKTLSAFDQWLEGRGIHTNTRSIIMRQVRRVFNKAIDEGLIGVDTYPFRKFKIRQADKEKEFLPVEDMRRVMALDLQGGEAMARDVFVLSFMLCGANPVDIFNMKPANNGVVSFVRTKIAHAEPQPIHITLQREAERIVERYRGRDYLLYFAERYASYATFKRFMARCLTRVGERLGIHLYFYLARYSWATYADELDVSERIIGKAFGHTGTSLADKRYISFKWSRVDDANRRVLNYLIYNT